MADIAELAAIVIGVLVALGAAFGLNDRINDLRVQSADAERRLDARIDASEGRTSTKLDKLSGQFTKMDERTSAIEGARRIPAR